MKLLPKVRSQRSSDLRHLPVNRSETVQTILTGTETDGVNLSSRNGMYPIYIQKVVRVVNTKHVSFILYLDLKFEGNE